MKFTLLLFTILSLCSVQAKEIEVRFVKEKPNIDGILSEGEWSMSDSAFGFIQLQPDKGSPASENTFVYVLQNEDYRF